MQAVRYGTRLRRKIFPSTRNRPQITCLYIFLSNIFLSDFALTEKFWTEKWESPYIYGLLTAIIPPSPGVPEPDDYPRNRARCNRCSFRRRGRIRRNFSTIRSLEPGI